jgi:hypothetical protein
LSSALPTTGHGGVVSVPQFGTCPPALSAGPPTTGHCGVFGVPQLGGSFGVDKAVTTAVVPGDSDDGVVDPSSMAHDAVSHDVVNGSRMRRSLRFMARFSCF